MSALPQKVLEAWANRDVPVILATVGKDNTPNIIYATCVGIFGNDRLVVADNFFSKTRANIFAGSKGAILFRDKSGTAYQVKGTLEYHKEGEIFQHMKSWNPPRHPGHAAVALKAEEVYSGAEKIS
ncbi:MAG: pyridoxamine 5'-phosphate oxidase family protein [Kiritimatiellae bacterium]|nr:pyridoxamine 5'-phosphate oxidase family protein [Kiritimatiellia bacterium]